MEVRGGKAYYGEAIGILLFDERRYPILPGDVANASTYDFPVRLKVVKGLVDVRRRRASVDTNVIRRMSNGWLPR